MIWKTLFFRTTIYVKSRRIKYISLNSPEPSICNLMIIWKALHQFSFSLTLP